MEAKGIKFPLCKAPRKTITEEIAARRSKVPHNTNYSPEKSSPRILGASKVTDSVTRFSEVALWQGEQTPSHYNAIPLDKIRPRIPNFTQKSKVERFGTLKDSPSPCSYSPDDLKTSARTLSPRIKFSKEPVVTFMQRHLKNKAFMPSAVQYNPDSGLKLTTLGASRGYK